eukprot:2993466-Rhodomonas_salina.3
MRKGVQCGRKRNRFPRRFATTDCTRKARPWPADELDAIGRVRPLGWQKRPWEEQNTRRRSCPLQSFQWCAALTHCSLRRNLVRSCVWPYACARVAIRIVHHHVGSEGCVEDRALEQVAVMMCV